MTVLDYRLEPFPGEWSPGIAIAGRITRNRSALALQVELAGDLDGVVVERSGGAPARRHGLWEGTCLELFLAPVESRGYWEFNLSPAGHWNVYRFSGYRSGIEEERIFRTLPFEFQERSATLHWSMEIDLSGIAPAPGPFHAAVCSVIKHETGPMSYWALIHCGPRPDFHRRESFALVI